MPTDQECLSSTQELLLPLPFVSNPIYKPLSVLLCGPSSSSNDLIWRDIRPASFVLELWARTDDRPGETSLPFSSDTTEARFRSRGMWDLLGRGDMMPESRSEHVDS